MFYYSFVAGKHILVPIGKASAEMNGILSMNEVGAEIWQVLEQDVTIDAIVEHLCGSFDVSEERARRDAIAFTDRLAQLGCLEETK